MYKKFQTTFKQPPSWVVRAPGRVNVIGEHVDHQLYEVLPCAIEQSIVIYSSSQSSEDEASSPGTACTETESSFLSIFHEDSTNFFPVNFGSFNDMRIRPELGWTNYILAAYIGVMEYLASDRNVDMVGRESQMRQSVLDKVRQKYPDAIFRHNLLVTGNVPRAAGLSSSSALVVAAAKTFCLGVDWTDISHEELAAICANCERLVGTAGGGMDQATICLSTPGFARIISFQPLSATPIPLPSELTIVVANSGREAPKVRDAAKMYNKRVFELKVGCLIILSKVDKYKAALLPPEEVMQLTVKQAVNEFLKTTESQALQSLDSLIERKPYTKGDIEKIMNIEQRNYLLDRRCGQSVWDLNDEFFIFERVRHVLSETLRVRKFTGLCLNYVRPNTPTPANVLIDLGQLIHESGKSLNEDYDCGCPETTELCEIAERNGSLGSRIVGAGWGGCIISLVPRDKVDNFKAAVIKEYFQPLITGQRPHNLEMLPSSMNQIEECLFSTVPSSGLSVQRLYDVKD